MIYDRLVAERLFDPLAPARSIDRQDPQMMLTDLADVLRRGGLTVVEQPGWQGRTQTDGPFTPRALVFHHDASGVGPSPSMAAYLADLSHPGAQLWVDYTGRWHVIAGGRMWHAGNGSGWGVVPANQGNTYAVGVETDHTTGEPWGPGQLEAVVRGFAVLCHRYGWDPHRGVMGHKEYAPGRKVDPDYDMAAFRDVVAAAVAEMADAAPVPLPTPTGPPALPRWPLAPGHYYGLLSGPARSHGGYLAAERAVVRIIQQRLIAKGYVPGITDWRSGWADGVFEQETADAVTRFQRREMPGTTYFGQVWSDDYARLAR